MKPIIFYILLIPLGIFAQNNRENESYIATDVFSPFYIHDSGIYYTPRWRLAYIKDLNEKSKVGIDIGYGNANSSFLNTGDKYSLWEVRPEYYRIINKNSNTIKYFALELFYINQNEEFNTQSYFSDQKEYLSFDKADYNRQKFGLIPKFGMFINLGKRIGLNIYTGMGVKYRINKYSNLVNIRERQLVVEHFMPYYRNEGSKIGLEFTLGIKIYYRIESDK